MPTRHRRRKPKKRNRVPANRELRHKPDSVRSDGLTLGRLLGVTGITYILVACVFGLVNVLYFLQLGSYTDTEENALDETGMLQSMGMIANGSLVLLDPTLYEYFENKLIEAPRHAYTTIALMNVMLDFSSIVQSLLCQAIVTRSQLNLFLKNSMVNMYVSSPILVASDVSSYTAINSSILIAYSDIATPEMIVNALRQEMFYAQVYMRNKMLNCNISRRKRKRTY